MPDHARRPGHRHPPACRPADRPPPASPEVDADRRADRRSGKPRQVGGTSALAAAIAGSADVPSRVRPRCRPPAARVGVAAGDQQRERLHQLHQRPAGERRHFARLADAERACVQHRRAAAGTPPAARSRCRSAWRRWRRLRAPPARSRTSVMPSSSACCSAAGIGAMPLRYTSRRNAWAQPMSRSVSRRYRIARLAEDRRHVRRHRDGVDVLRQRGAADEAALRLQHLAGDVGEHQRMPVLVQVFVRDVARVLLADVRQPVLERRIGHENTARRPASADRRNPARRAPRHRTVRGSPRPASASAPASAPSSVQPVVTL